MAAHSPPAVRLTPPIEVTMSRRSIAALILLAFAAACASPTAPTSSSTAKKDCPVIVTGTC